MYQNNYFFVGVDPAISNTGLVILSSRGNLVHACNTKYRGQRLSKKDPYQYLLRLGEISDYILDKISTLPRKNLRVGYENYSFDSPHYAYAIAEQSGILKLALVKACQHIQLIEPSRVKKFATNYGRATKDQIIAQARKECPGISQLSNRQCSSDVCDAYFLAKFVWHRYAPDLVVKHETSRDMLRMRLELARQGPESDRDLVRKKAPQTYRNQKRKMPDGKR